MNKQPTRGQSLVEFALIFPLAIFLLLGAGIYLDARRNG